MKKKLFILVPAVLLVIVLMFMYHDIHRIIIATPTLLFVIALFFWASKNK